MESRGVHVGEERVERRLGTLAEPALHVVHEGPDSQAREPRGERRDGRVEVHEPHLLVPSQVAHLLIRGRRVEVPEVEVQGESGRRFLCHSAP